MHYILTHYGKANIIQQPLSFELHTYVDCRMEIQIPCNKLLDNSNRLELNRDSKQMCTEPYEIRCFGQIEKTMNALILSLVCLENLFG